jgi:serine/threonine-protein kinase
MNDPSEARRAWERVEAILDEALDLPAEERASHVEGRTAGEPGLRDRVMRLLAATENAEGRFETPPSVPAEILSELASERTTGSEGAADGDQDRDQLSPGDRVGAYRVESLLGRGGMGSVYLARRADGAFDQSVALKVVKRGVDTDEVRARFQQEREILARLQHPAIAALLHGGVTESGLPYFAMEVARGEPIDRWCDAQKLGLADRIRLFIRVCEAVAYAHRSLVVHRDLKPSNILVLPDGQPKLLDFGIAKLLEDDGDMALTSLVGPRVTPDYAAPEQIAGEPTTTATDVYSLGVILYELVAGARPYRATGDPGDAVRLRAGGVVSPPSRAASGPRAAELRGDLDAIVMKAMRVEPDRRYTSASALAEDLDRFLKGLPVEARPDSTRYRVGKFVRRHRVPVGLGAAAVVALVAGTVSTTLMARAADRERERREVEAERATAARDFVVDLFAGLDPDQLDGRTTFSRDELIELGIRNLDDLGDQPGLRAGIMNALGRLSLNLGDRETAETFFRDAHDLLADEPASADLSGSMLGLGEVLRARLEFDEAETWLRRAVDIDRALLPPGDPRLVEAEAALAFALYNQGPSRFDEAETIYQRLSRASASLPLPLRARVSEGFADLRYGQRRFAEAEVLYREALEQQRAGAGRRDSDYARTQWGLGHTLVAQEKGAEAVEVYRASLDLLTRIYGDRHADVAWAQYNLGGALAATGEMEDAAATFGAAARLMEELNPPGYLYAAFAWIQLARAQEQLGRLPAALQSYRSVVRVYDAIDERGASPSSSRRASVYRDMARVFGALQQGDSVAVYTSKASALEAAADRVSGG